VFAHEIAALQPDTAAFATAWNAQCVANGRFAMIAATYAPDPRVTLDELKEQASKFDQRKFVQIATDGWRKANAALPQKPMQVCVYLAHEKDTFTRDFMGGVAGVTAGQGLVILRIHPDADWQPALAYTLAHEMHHSYWAQHDRDVSKPFTLADWLVFEGRADFFATSLFDHRAPWTAALSADDYAAAWQEISPDLNVTAYRKMSAYMFGIPPSGLPMWGGYRIGYHLVTERMARAPILDLKAMSVAPASEFMPRLPQ
jgi:uncharacterized protein YjaZ